MTMSNFLENQSVSFPITELNTFLTLSKTRAENFGLNMRTYRETHLNKMVLPKELMDLLKLFCEYIRTMIYLLQLIGYTIP